MLLWYRCIYLLLYISSEFTLSLSVSRFLLFSLSLFQSLAMEPDPNKDIVCQLCGAWFETRKGLSSHARAHLRHFGVEYSESKGSPIDLLNRLILTDDFKRRVASLSPSAGIEDLRSLVSFSTSTSTPASSSPPSSSLPSKRPLLPSSPTSPLLFKASTGGGGAGPKTTSSSLFGPPSKKPRASPHQVFRLSGGELTPYSQGGQSSCLLNIIFNIRILSLCSVGNPP